MHIDIAARELCYCVLGIEQGLVLTVRVYEREPVGPLHDLRGTGSSQCSRPILGHQLLWRLRYNRLQRRPELRAASTCVALVRTRMKVALIRITR